jgi:hypothetical protein
MKYNIEKINEIGPLLAEIVEEALAGEGQEEVGKADISISAAAAVPHRTCPERVEGRFPFCPARARKSRRGRVFTADSAKNPASATGGVL